MSRSDGASVPDDHVIVLFGALGDLSKRKLLPGLFHLDRAGLMPAGYKVIGTSRKGGSDDDFRRVAREAIGEAAGETWERFSARLSFSRFAAEEPEPLQEAVSRAEQDLDGEPGACTTSRSRRTRSATRSRRSGPPGWPTARASCWRSRSGWTSRALAH